MNQRSTVPGMLRVAEALRNVTAAMQRELDSGRRSTQVDAHDLVEVLLAIADELDPPLVSKLNEPTRPS